MHRFRSTFPRVMVVGTGALGSALAHLLAHRGAERVLLIDPERVEPHNLLCSEFLAQALAASGFSAGETTPLPYKAALLQDEAARAFGLSWQSAVAEIADVGLGTLREFDVICSCTDSALSRAETALAARLLRMPMLDCGVFGDNIAAGRVSYFANTQNAACYLCGMGENRRAQLLAYAASASLGCAPAPTDVSMTGSSDTVLHTAAKAVRLLESIGAGSPPSQSTAWRLFQTPPSGGQEGDRPGVWDEGAIALSPGSTCPWHDGLPGDLVPLPWRTPLRESLPAHLSGGLLQLHWPLCTHAICRDCGTAAQPFQRIARVRRTVHCEGCFRIGTLEPTASVSTIAPEDPLAALSPRELHLPERQLHLLRPAFAWPAMERPWNEPPS